MGKKNDYGFYGSGLDGYVHYRQGMAEAERNAPHSSSSYSSYDTLDDSYDELDDSYSGSGSLSHRSSSPSAAAKPVRRPTAKKSEPTDWEQFRKWIFRPLNAVFVISWALFLVLDVIMEATSSQNSVLNSIVTFLAFLTLFMMLVKLIRFLLEKP